MLDIDNLNDDDYILFVFQNANFAARSMLIPAKKYLLHDDRRKDYDILVANRRKLTLREHGVNLDINVNNVFINNI